MRLNVYGDGTDNRIGWKFSAEKEEMYNTHKIYPSKRIATAAALWLAVNNDNGDGRIHDHAHMKRNARGIIIVTRSGNVLRVEWRPSDVLSGFVGILYRHLAKRGGHMMLAQFLPGDKVDVFNPNGHGYAHPAANAIARATKKTLADSKGTAFKRYPQHKLSDDDAQSSSGHSAGMCQIICAMQMWSS